MDEELGGIGFETGFALPEDSLGRPLDPEHLYDVLILGAGPAGLSSAIYLIRKGLDTAVISGNIGGQVTWTSAIENYLGYRLIEGVRLIEKFHEQLREFPIGIELGTEVTSLSGRGGAFEVRAGDKTFRAAAIILATGKRPRMLNVPGEKRLLGRGVAYCAICDAPLYRGKATVVIGGGNSGLEAALDLARGSPKVYVVERAERLLGDQVLVERLRGLGNVEIITGAEVAEILGDERVGAVRIRRGGGEATEEIAVEGVFVEIGLVPNSEPFRGFVALSERGEVEVDYACRTSTPGVFAAGDVTTVPYKQIIVAAGEGAKAALSAADYLLRRRDED